MPERKIEFKAGGSVILRVKRAGGIHQRLVFRMVAEPSAAGPYKLLDCDMLIPINELAALADEVGLPVRARGIPVFPKGKASKDFLI
ncbi:MAG: hypothetical protein N3G76_00960 [Candidatus Micrarchaeota archaeon]|nr:hypothetical protein [Candidatus Micrarchaeota archaeon]